MREDAASCIHFLAKFQPGWVIYFSVFFGLVMPQPSFAFSYIALGGEGDLIEVSSFGSLRQATPIVWSQNRISLAIDLDSVDAPLSEGISDQNNGWNVAALVSMEKWNAAESGFYWEQDSVNNSGDICATSVSEDGINQIAWSANYCGGGWDGDILALTQITYLITEVGGIASAEIIDTHILVNSNKRWDIYNGPLAYATGGAPIYDLQRVLLHELGHGLGLTHPDENGQNIASIMLSTESDTYNLTSDDVAGVNALYPEEQLVGGVSTITRGSGGGGSFDAFLMIYIILGLLFKRVAER